MSGQIHNVVN